MISISKINELRTRLKSCEKENTAFAKLWRTLKAQGQAYPEQNPWILPFIALVERNENDINNAKKAIADYLNSANKCGEVGYLFNIWCFAFPHCRWAIWFKLMCDAKFYSEQEIEELSAQFLLIQFRDNHPTLNVKPNPECVDNQAASLALSSYLIGSIFKEQNPKHKNLATMLYNESVDRLESMIGGMPTGGYSGEGSTYQGLIVSSVVPFLLEALEEIAQKDLFNQPLRPNNVSAEQVLRATRDLWMPGGTMLPLDDYGYQMGTSLPLAFYASRTGDPKSLQILENMVNQIWNVSFHIAWGYDTPVWSLIYWPEAKATQCDIWESWASSTVGGVLVDSKGENYLMQMWDPCESMCLRSHVNPNSLILAHKGIPFSADGDSHGKDLTYKNAFFSRFMGKGDEQHLNLFKGCAGSHNSILIDNNEGMRPVATKCVSKLAFFDKEQSTIIGDVSTLYKENYADCLQLKRKSQLIDNRFWLVEDLASFENEHQFTSRWWFRPQTVATLNGVDVQTPEGALLQLRVLEGDANASVKRINQFPVEPDNCSDRVDFTQRAKCCRWLYLLWPTMTIEDICELNSNWIAYPLDSPSSVYNIPVGELPWSIAGVEVKSAWHFECSIELPERENIILQLPWGIDNSSKFWLNDRVVSIENSSQYKILPQQFECSRYLDDSLTLKIALEINFAVGEAGKYSNFSWPNQPIKLCRKILKPEIVTDFSYGDNEVKVTSSSAKKYTIPYKLMEEK